MKLLVFFAAVLLTVNASTDKDQWENFKHTHGKTYKSMLEERIRFGIFQKNLRTVEEHNAKYEKGEETHFMAINNFADMTEKEFKQMLGLQNGEKPNLNATLHIFPETLKAPDSIDWVEKGAVLAVKSQEGCGSCWSFSTTGAVEGQNAIVKKVKIPLSEQQLIDCSRSYGNGNCSEGGLMNNAFAYIKDMGIEAESSYPYLGKENPPCRYDAKKVVVKIKGFKGLTESEEELKKAVGTVGPVSVTLATDNLQLYGGGIITRPCKEPVDHGVLVVGYGKEGGRKFWRIKNSWGTTWGEEGYWRIARDAGNMCQIASGASYPYL